MQASIFYILPNFVRFCCYNKETYAMSLCNLYYQKEIIDGKPTTNLGRLGC